MFVLLLGTANCACSHSAYIPVSLVEHVNPSPSKGGRHIQPQVKRCGIGAASGWQGLGSHGFVDGVSGWVDAVGVMSVVSD